MHHLSLNENESTSKISNASIDYVTIFSNIAPLVLGVLFLFLLNITLNGPFFHNPRVLYSDELVGYLDTYTNQDLSIWDVIFGNEVIRPIPRALCLALYSVCQNNYNLINQVLLLLNFLVCITLYFSILIVWHDSKNQYSVIIVATICSSLYLAAEFMQCQIFSILGIMESLGHIAVIICTASVVLFLRRPNVKNYLLAILFWVAATLCHERFIALVAIILISVLFVFLLKRLSIRKAISAAIIPLTLLSVYIYMRSYFLQGNALRGTGGNSIADTSLGSVAKSFAKAIAYLFNINAGPSMNNGINYKDVPAFYNVLIVISIIAVVLVFGSYLIHIVRSGKPFVHGAEIVLLLLSAACCLIAPSMTGEPALRFIYAPYSLCLIALSGVVLYLYSYIDKPSVVLIILLYVVCTFSIQAFYRTHINNVALWPQKLQAESLYDTTLGQDQKAAFSSTYYVVDSNGYLNQYGTNCWKFFSPYIGDRQLTIHTFKTLPEASNEMEKNSDAILLVLDNETNQFVRLVN